RGSAALSSGRREGAQVYCHERSWMPSLSHLDQLDARSWPWSAPRDASGWVAPGVDVEARHVAGVRRHEVIPDAVPEDGVAEGIAVHRDRAAGRTEDGDGRSRGARR